MGITPSEIEVKLEELYREHQNLDDIIDNFHFNAEISSIDLKRLKKRKLFLKDQISYFESTIHPDMIA